MNSKELYIKENNEYKLVKYYCGKCGMIYNDKENAEKCCKPVICTICGKEIPQEKGKKEFYYINPIRCQDCYRKEKEDKMPIVDYYNDEPIYDGNYFYADLDDYIDSFDGTEEDIPEWVEICDKIDLPKINSYDIIENLLEQCNLEDNFCMYDDVYKFHEFVENWNDKQKNKKLWQPSGKKLIISEEIKEEIIKVIRGE